MLFSNLLRARSSQEFAVQRATHYTTAPNELSGSYIALEREMVREEGIEGRKVRAEVVRVMKS